MELFFNDPKDPRLPPQEVRIRTLNVEPYSDGQRIRVFLELTPFLKRPSCDIYICASDGQTITSTNIIETMMSTMRLTMHLKGEVSPGKYIVKVTVFYPQDTQEANQEMKFDEQKLIVDEGETSFSIQQKEP